MEKELALELVRVTEAAALASAQQMGRGNKNGADQAAVDAMRRAFDAVSITGTVVIGEGEMDEAPMLYIGEALGAGGLEVDVAVDPVEGTNLVAKGLPGAWAVLAVAPKGNLLHAPDTYMEKLAVGPQARGAIDLNASVSVNLHNVAEALGKKVSELTVVILDRPRHEQLIGEVRQAGARIRLISDGDVAPCVEAGFHQGVDLLMGIGGAPEGVLAAAALKSVGGDLQARLVPVTRMQRDKIASLGLNTEDIFTIDDLVKGDDVMFAATAITGGELLRGVAYRPQRRAITHSLVMRSSTGTVRFIEAHHHLEKKSWLLTYPQY